MGGATIAVRLILLSTLAAAAMACAVETTTGTEEFVSGGAGGGGGTTRGTGGAASTGKSSGSKTPSASPMLVRVDPDVTMNASPGQGVGVFAEYDRGGHWHLWWTCDTNVTGESCPFDVKVTVARGGITNAASEQFASTDTLVTPTTPAAGEAGAVEAKTQTTTGSPGMLFDTAPGATITVSATVGGLYSGAFLFWVQGGKIDDGFRGTLTDPLQLVGASP